MKLSVVIPVLNQHDLAASVYAEIRKNTNCVERKVEFVILDNGSSPALAEQDFPGARIVRFEKTIGVYPTFREGFKAATGDVVAFFHSDLVVWEMNWNVRVIEEFEVCAFVNLAIPKFNKPLGMIGFIGSNEIDGSGGRGLGTTSNFAGKLLDSRMTLIDKHIPVRLGWKGSPAAAHGKHSSGISNAAVVDGCAMIISRQAWNAIGFRDDFPIHHFYDRLISTQMLEHGFDIEVMGVECDHFSGQTVCKEGEYHKVAELWCRANIDEKYFVQQDGRVNWDATIYQEAERRWLNEYRAKGFVPTRV